MKKEKKKERKRFCYLSSSSIDTKAKDYEFQNTVQFSDSSLDQRPKTIITE